MSFEEFQDSCHLGYQNRNGLTILNLIWPRCLPLRSGLIRHMVWEEVSFEEFQDVCHGGHLGPLDRMILAILNCHVALTQVLVQSTMWFRSCLKNVKMADISESFASHHVLVQYNMR